MNMFFLVLFYKTLMIELLYIYFIYIYMYIYIFVLDIRTQ
jgi:hypothetical protein